MTAMETITDLLLEIMEVTQHQPEETLDCVTICNKSYLLKINAGKLSFLKILFCRTELHEGLARMHMAQEMDRIGVKVSKLCLDIQFSSC